MPRWTSARALADARRAGLVGFEGARLAPPCWAAVYFLSPAGCRPGPDGSCLLAALSSLKLASHSPFILGSDCLAGQVNSFSAHVIAASRPSMLSLLSASPGPPHGASTPRRPPTFCWILGGQIKSDSQTTTHKCMECQNFSFLIPIWSDNIFLFVIFFFLKNSAVP